MLTRVSVVVATIYATTKYDIVAMSDQLVNLILTKIVKYTITDIATYAYRYALLLLMPFTLFNRVIIYVYSALTIMLSSDVATIFILTVYLFTVYTLFGYVKFITRLVYRL